MHGTANPWGTSSSLVGSSNSEVDMFKLTSLSQAGSKSLIQQYKRFGFKHISTKYDEKKQVYINTFK